MNEITYILDMQNNKTIKELNNASYVVVYVYNLT